MDLIQENEAPQISFDQRPYLLQYPMQAVNRIIEKFPTCSSSFAKHALIKYSWNERNLIAHLEWSHEFVMMRIGCMGQEVPAEVLPRCFACNSETYLVGVGCGHRMCVSCFRNYCQGRVRGGDIQVHCPFYKCGKFFPYEDVEEVLDEQLLFVLKVCIFADCVNKRDDLSWCPNINCRCLIKHDTRPLVSRCITCGFDFAIQVDGKVVVFDASTVGRKRKFYEIVD